MAIGLVVGLAALGAFLHRDGSAARKDGPKPEATRRKARAGFFPTSFFSIGDAQTSEVMATLPEDMTAWVPVPVKIVDERGNAVPHADVEIRAGRREYAVASGQPQDELEYEQENAPLGAANVVLERTRTDAKGTVTVRIPMSLAALILGRDATGREGLKAVQIYGEETEPVSVEISALGHLSGTVVSERGAPVAGAKISVRSRIDAALAHVALPEQAAGDMRTDARGNFQIPFRTAGAFDIEITQEGFQVLTEEAVQVLPGRESKLNLTLLAAATLGVSVTSESGDGLLGVAVEARSISNGTAYAAAPPLRDGRTRFDQLAAGDYFVYVTAPGFVAQQVTARTGTEEVPIVMRRSGGLAGVVRLPALHVVESETRYFSVSVISVENPDAGTISQSTSSSVQDESGEFSFEQLAPGTYEVYASTPGWISDWMRVRVASGDVTRVELHADRGAAITGTVRFADGRRVESGYVSISGRTIGKGVNTDADGNFSIEALPADRYSLNVSAVDETGAASSYSGQQDIRSGQSLSFVVDPPVPYEAVAVLDPVMPVGEDELYDEFRPDLALELIGATLVVRSAGATIEPRLFGGDRIVSIDGRSFDGGSSNDFAAGREGSVARVVIERPATGETITVEIPRTIEVDRGYRCGLSRRTDWDW